MLLNLLPPILIIASLIGIILMLVKKSKQVADLPEDHFDKEIVAAPEQLSFFGRLLWRMKNIRWDDVKHFFLGILERVTRRIRVVFLKLESRSADLSNNIRSQRQARANRMMPAAETRKENDILEKLKNYRPTEAGDMDTSAKESITEENQLAVSVEEAGAIVKSSEKRGFFTRKSKAAAVADKVTEKVAEEEEREIKPIISDRLVTPRGRTEIKDRLEELLIERIAVNPKDIEAYERLGEYYMEIKSYMDAKECFKQVIKLNPSDRNAKYRMRRLENILAKQ